MINTQESSRIHLTILDRVTQAGLNIPEWKILMAIRANKGEVAATDIAQSTGATFNWHSATTMYDRKMLERERVTKGKSVAYLYVITAYGKRVLNYISSGKGQV
jgi:DNA-binding MarR family transcriptional regulator